MSKQLKSISTTKTIKTSIDEFTKLHNKIHLLEVKKSENKDKISAFGRKNWAKRLFSNIKGNFRLPGEKSAVSFITMAKSANIGEKQYNDIKEKWGSDVVEDCLERDAGTVKFDADTYEQHKDLINKTLTELGSKIGSDLLIGISYGLKKEAFELISDNVESADQLEELMTDLRVITQIRVS